MGLCYLYSRATSFSTFGVVSPSKSLVALLQGFSAQKPSALPIFQADFCNAEKEKEVLVVWYHQIKSWVKMGEWQNVEGKSVGLCFPARGKE